MLLLLTEFKDSGGAVLFSTHSMAAAESVCDRVVMLAQGRTVFEGLLDNATALAPHGAIVVTSDASGLISAALMVGGSATPLATAVTGATRWRVVLPAAVTHPALMRALSEVAVPIISFDPIKADLEAAFWQFAGGAAEEQPGQSRAA
jgi:ABC-2 type transport system ATP-binding protein